MDAGRMAGGAGRNVCGRVGQLLVCVGVGLLVAAFAAFTAKWWSVRLDVRAQGVVTDNEPVQDATGAVTYSTHVRFRLPGGSVVIFTDSDHRSQSDDPAFPAGKRVPVLYPAGRPEAARVATLWRVYALAIELAIAGTVVTDVGLIVGRWRRG